MTCWMLCWMTHSGAIQLCMLLFESSLGFVHRAESFRDCAALLDQTIMPAVTAKIIILK